jgi:uncharacterized damage-inducible protein DinB
VLADFTVRPGPDEHAADYAGYVEQVPAGDVLEALARGLRELLAALQGVEETRASHRYAEGKWSLREVVGHLVDTERVFAGRAMQFARGETQPLPGMDQDDYVREAAFEERPLASLLEELEHLRRANLALFRSLGEKELARRGTASGHEVSVRALLFIIAGHERHHLRVLRERYLQ